MHVPHSLPGRRDFDPDREAQAAERPMQQRSRQLVAVIGLGGDGGMPVRLLRRAITGSIRRCRTDG